MSTLMTEDRGSQVNAVNYAFLVLSTIAVILRFWGRFVAHKARFWWDDWLSLAALVHLPHSTLSSLCILTPLTLAFRLGDLWTLALLGVHWTGKTH